MSHIQASVAICNPDLGRICVFSAISVYSVSCINCLFMLSCAKVSRIYKSTWYPMPFCIIHSFHIGFYTERDLLYFIKFNISSALCDFSSDYSLIYHLLPHLPFYVTFNGAKYSLHARPTFSRKRPVHVTLISMAQPLLPAGLRTTCIACYPSSICLMYRFNGSLRYEPLALCLCYITDRVNTWWRIIHSKVAQMWQRS